MEFLDSIVLSIVNGLRSLTGDTATFPLVLMFLAIVLGVLTVPRLVKARDAVPRRLASAPQAAAAAGSQSLRPRESDSLWNQLLTGLEKRAVPAGTKTRTTVRMRMIQAGYLGRNAPRNYYAIRLILSIAMPIGFLFVAPFFSRSIPVENLVFTGFCLVVLGLYLPSAWVSMRIRDRQRSIQESFPDSLDMLMVCVEAGLGLDAAFSRVGEQMAMAHPVLAEQYAMVSLELRAGKSREAAMRNMSERVGIPEITSFVILLIQSDELGTSVAQTLRVQAEEMRIKRMLRAEEKAHMLSVKMSVVLILFLLPAMFVAILSPAIIRLVRQVIPLLTGSG